MSLFSTEANVDTSGRAALKGLTADERLNATSTGGKKTCQAAAWSVLSVRVIDEPAGVREAYGQRRSGIVMGEAGQAALGGGLTAT
jgi:hypothetical protein